MWTLRWWLSRHNRSGVSPLYQVPRRMPQPLRIMYDGVMAWILALCEDIHILPVASLRNGQLWRALMMFCYYLEQVVDETIVFPVIWKAMALIWCNCNAHCINDLERPLTPSPTPDMASIMYLFAGTSRAIVVLHLASGVVNAKYFVSLKR